MIRRLRYPMLLCLLLVPTGTHNTYAQTDEPPSENPSQQHLKQIQLCREGILDANSRPADRLRSAELLLTYRSNEADQLVNELLGANDAALAQVAMCEAIADVSRASSERLHPDWTPSLIQLLRSTNDSLRDAAARALANFPVDAVVVPLAELAANKDNPLNARRAAIDALAPNIHRRDVISHLIKLLDTANGELTDYVLDALAPASLQPLDRNIDQWKAWWKEKSRLSERAWQAHQIRVYRDRIRGLERTRAQERAELLEKLTSLGNRTYELQREIYRALPAEQAESKLAEWLGGSVPAVKLNALNIIMGRVADDDYRPEGAVLAALLKLLSDPDPLIRRESLKIIPHATPGTATDEVLARLEQETDPTTRAALLSTLGELKDVKALPALIAAIEKDSPDTRVLQAAAIALGRIAPAARGTESAQAAVDPLKRRYAAIGAKDTELRGALLAAMAGLAAPEFQAEFIAALDSENPQIVRPALEGLTALSDASQVERVRKLASHEDPRVRIAAYSALGVMGLDDADLERLLAGLDPAVEKDAAARAAAWRGIRNVLAKRSVSDRLAWAKRFASFGDLEVQYLKGWLEESQTGNGGGGEATVRENLAEALIRQNRPADAAAQLRELYTSLQTAGDPRARQIAVKWMEAALRAEPDEVAVAVKRFAEDDLPAAVVEQLAQSARDYVLTLTGETEEARREAILDALAASSLGESWQVLLADLAPTHSVEEPSPAQPNETTNGTSERG